ncbi:hypothetical protein [Phenylobacterium sp.]|uniref:hypothetical protein n=1 Tax=Phenylobacterium sp. TaxID=1871053 RepID=UPI0019A4B011|nr:hypothetical protein [Phenylobacterium sp.]MBC7166678.1 hypothetical protein [Phenylobacterium sp.]
MRKLSLAVLILAAAPAAQAHAQVVQDRYGPPPAHQLAPTGPEAPPEGAAQAAAYGGTMLGWANKRSPRAETATAAAAPQRPQALALAHQFARPASSPPTPPTAVQPGYEPVGRAEIARATPALLGGPPAAPLPQSLYGPAQAAAPSAQQTAQAAPAGGGRTHLYSVHRPYGLTPDAIPAPPAGDRYILVGPPDAPAPSEEAADDAEGLDRQF